MQSDTVIVFPPFRLDWANERLWCGEQPIHLRPKTFAVLRCLLEHPGQLLTKAALLQAVWPETVVSEAVLLGCIRDLRRALHDDPKQPQFIETVHRRGYRFIAPISAPVSPDRPAVIGGLHHTPSPRFRRPQHFVGRDAELAQLMQWWTTARQGTRQVVVIAGEPGIGKTALVEAFVSEVVARADVRVGHGQCVQPYGPGEPYLPVLEALARLCREPHGDSLVSVLRQFAPSWLLQMPALVPPAEREALQRTVGPFAQRRMLRELTEALDAFTTTRPLVMVLEDLHWSDGATLEWLAYVARRRDPARLMLVCTYRPVDAVVQAHPLRAVFTEIQQHGQCVELALDYLSEDEVTAYLRQRFAGARLAADLAGVLHQRTYGNPLFLTAVVDEIVRQQIVREEPDGWDMLGHVETITTIVPATLRVLIEHQLAHCSPEAQTLLEVASVAGVEFAAAAVAAGLERADDEIEAQCATLAQQEQFLQTRGRAEWPDGTVTACFGFRHALYQDVVYQRLPAGRQTRWHARIGSRLAQGFGEQVGDLAPALAMHFVRGRMLPQAVLYLRQAGETAMVRAAHREAVGYFEQALEAWQHLPESRDTMEQGIDLLCNLRQALVPLQDFARGFEHLRAAETLAQRLGDRQRLGRIDALMTHYFWFVGEYEHAIERGQRVLALTDSDGYGPLQATVNNHLGQIYYALGNYEQALDALRQNVAFFAGKRSHESAGMIGPVLGATGSYTWIAHCLGELGRFTDARWHAHEAVRIAEAAAHLSSTMYAHYCLGRLALRQGDPSQAILVLEPALARCRAANIPLWHRLLAATLGVAYALHGRVADTGLLLEEAVAMPEGGSISTGIYMYVSLGEAALLTDRLEEARRHARSALELARAGTERGDQAWTYRLLGDIDMHSDPPEVDQAAAHYHQALALADALGMRPLAAHCHYSLGMLYLKTQRQGQARTALSTAIALYNAMEMTFWLQQAQTALAEVARPTRVARRPHNV